MPLPKPIFHQFVSLGDPYAVGFGNITREEWETFIAEVKEGKHDWPVDKPKPRAVTLIAEDHSSKTLMNGDSCVINGATVKVYVG